MPRTISKRVELDMTQLGDSVDVDVRAVGEVAATAMDAWTWGSGVVTISKVYGGVAVGFTSAKTLSSGTTVQENIDIAGDVLAVRLAVTTAGDGMGRILVTGKETGDA